MNEILSTFNSINERLKFTLEVGGDVINFLDVSIRVEESFIKFDLFFKPTFSGRFLNFYSHHPLTHKRGIVIGLVDRILALSHPKFHEKNFLYIINLLLDNNYPLDFIFNTIRNRIKFHINKKDKSEKLNNNENTKYFIIPYIKNISEKFNFVKIHDQKIAYTCINKISKFIKTGKDTLHSSEQCNVVYKISCSECDSTYVGQTKRKLKTRVTEHRSDIKKRSGSPSVITQHRLNFNHDFGWDKVEILDRERCYGRRLISEMLHIKSQDFGLNKQEDTEFLPESYLPLLSPT